MEHRFEKQAEMTRTIIPDGKTKHTLELLDGSILKGLTFTTEGINVIGVHDILDVIVWRERIGYVKDLYIERELYEVEVVCDPGFTKEEEESWYETIFVQANNLEEAWRIAEKTLKMRFPNCTDIEMQDKMGLDL